MVLIIPLDSAIYGTDRPSYSWPHGTRMTMRTIPHSTLRHFRLVSAVAFLCRPEINEICVKSLSLTARADMKSQNITHQKSQ